MQIIKRFFGALYFHNLFFYVGGCFVLLFLLGSVWGGLVIFLRILLLLWAAMCVYDLIFLFKPKEIIEAERILPSRFSNGDENQILLQIRSKINSKISLSIIDEVPIQFQARDFLLKLNLNPFEKKELPYALTPFLRGNYEFGKLMVFVNGYFGFFGRRFVCENSKEVMVFPSFLRLPEYELRAATNQLLNPGEKRIQKVGANTEYEWIKEYAFNDDIRTVNWKATARKGVLMVNVYNEEKSQDVFNLIDAGRTMKMPFEKMSLLDYAINASLAISTVCLKKSDRIGLFVAEKRNLTYLPPSKQKGHITKANEMLYRLETSFMETDYQRLVSNVQQRLNKRSLIFFYSNFGTLQAVENALPYLKMLAARHLLVMIVFKNTELEKEVETKSSNLIGVYQHIFIQQMLDEKRQIIQKLEQNGIKTVYTAPKDLSIKALNKYLEFKRTGAF